MHRADSLASAFEIPNMFNGWLIDPPPFDLEGVLAHKALARCVLNLISYFAKHLLTRSGTGSSCPPVLMNGTVLCRPSEETDAANANPLLVH